ncbi:MAG: 2OG-Fe(II) oxygenase [Synechococcales cyanobacterium C42_A2020_086]|jgi:peroxiredoxin/predicted 2-oxoglutarate/Fe(II)-dependent dioxygenase YbiX|nr:2OG-Fe(II) oxygenase [Synechococcales cyanobacterium M58_A2018_015]MBF2074744.1 2OG-Fe(II) oxygenase [Synechococcales cyanobacterium C42_A2020_086]
MAVLTTGDPVPWFTLPSTSNPNYHFDTVGGYRVILFFFGSTQSERAAAALQDFCNMQPQLAALGVPFFGVGIDPNDQHLAQQIQEPTYCKFLWDFEQRVSRQYGVCAPESSDQTQYAPTTFVLNENLHVLRVFPLEQPEHYAAQILEYVTQLPALEPPQFARRQAPVLFIPQVFDPEFCQELIQLYQSNGGRDSGFMRDINGKTVEILDPGFKKRRDINLSDWPTVQERVNALVLRRVKPEIEKAFQFSITRFERNIIACYDAANQGFFNRHRDNTTKGTAHRRFAMTLNLNTGEYEGGCLRFPEYGTQLYRPNPGEAVIFSCSLLHEVTPVTKGFRYALLSFFYSDEDAQLRERNRKYLATQSNPEEPTRERVNPSQTKGFQPKANKKRR